MKSIIFIVSLFIAGISFSSCEDMLDVKVKSEISGSIYWKSENDFEPYLYGIYSQIRVHTNKAFDFAEDRSEMWKAGYNNRFSSYWNHDITSGKTAEWTDFYGTIGHCNLLLYQIDHFDFANPALKKQLLAETYALRAYMYFYIAKIWGDVPLLLEPIFTEKDPLYPRSAVASVFEQINSDLAASLTYFEKAGYVDKYRISKPAVYAILADVKMWEASVLGGGDQAYREAIQAIEEVEKSGVKLLSEYGDIFDLEKNDEIIWSLYLDRAEYTSGKYNEAFLRFDTSGGADNVSDLPIALAGQQAYCLSEEALALFETYPEDKRIARTYIPELIEGEARNYWPNKFRGTQYSDTRVADSDMILYRLSDLYLLKAEAYAALKNQKDAAEYLNKVRSRAGIPAFSTTDLRTLQKEILNERGRELFHEIKRWWDLVRAHKTGVIDVYQYVPNLRGKTTPLYWAIHLNNLTKNDKLVQTEGYDD